MSMYETLIRERKAKELQAHYIFLAVKKALEDLKKRKYQEVDYCDSTGWHRGKIEREDYRKFFGEKA